MGKLLTPGTSYRVNTAITWRLMGYTQANLGMAQGLDTVVIEEGCIVEVGSVDYPPNLRNAPNLSVEAIYRNDLWLIDPTWLSPLPSIWGKPAETAIFVFIESGSKLAKAEGGLDTGWYWYTGLRLNPTDASYSPTSQLHGEFATRTLAEIDAADYGIKQQLQAQELTAHMKTLPKWVGWHDNTNLQSYWVSVIWHNDRFWALARGYHFKQGHLLHGESSTVIGQTWQDAHAWVTRMYGEAQDASEVQPLR